MECGIYSQLQVCGLDKTWSQITKHSRGGQHRHDESLDVQLEYFDAVTTPRVSPGCFMPFFFEGLVQKKVLTILITGSGNKLLLIGDNQ